MSVLVAFGMMFICTTTANAASGPLKAVQYDTIYVGSTTMGSLSFEPSKSNPTESDWNKIDKCTLVSVKSSNSKVLKAVKDGTSMYSHYLQPVKTGKATVTVKYKYKGNKYTIKKTVKVKKYPKAIKTITVNGKSIDLGKKKYRFDYDVDKYKKTSAKVKIKPATGWKIVSAYMGMAKGSKDEWKEIKVSTIKKGNAITIKKGYDAYMFITLECTSGDNKGDNFTYAVRFYRKDLDL
jgi:hypothetical protein